MCAWAGLLIKVIIFDSAEIKTKETTNQGRRNPEVPVTTLNSSRRTGEWDIALRNHHGFGAP